MLNLGVRIDGSMSWSSILMSCWSRIGSLLAKLLALVKACIEVWIEAALGMCIETYACLRVETSLVWIDIEVSGLLLTVIGLVEGSLLLYAISCKVVGWACLGRVVVPGWLLSWVVISQIVCLRNACLRLVATIPACLLSILRILLVVGGTYLRELLIVLILDWSSLRELLIMGCADLTVSRIVLIVSKSRLGRHISYRLVRLE